MSRSFADMNATMNSRGRGSLLSTPAACGFAFKTVTLLFLTLLSSNVSYAQGLPASLNNGLVAYFPFNGNANDESGNGHHGTIVGNQVTLTSGIDGAPNRAYRFTGIADQNRITGSGVNLANSSLSVSFWFKKDYAQFEQEHGWILSLGSEGQAGKALLFSSNYGGSVFRFSFYFDDFDIQSPAVGEGAWSHIVGTFDAETRERRIYIDGNFIASNTAQYGFSGTDIFNFHAQGGGENTAIAGLLDQVRFYNRVLTPSEITALHEGEASQLPWLRVKVKTIQVEMNVQIGKTYQLESSTDLETWAPYGLPFTAFANSYTNDVDVSEGYRYFQVREYVAP